MSISKLIEESARAGVFLFLKGENLGFRLSVDEFPEVLKEKIVQQKSEIIEYLSASKDQGDYLARPDIVKVDYSDTILLSSFSQRRLWFIDQLEGGSAHYNTPQAFRVEGAFDVLVAEEAIGRIIARHESLRTVFEIYEDEPIQRVKEEFKFVLQTYNFSSEGKAEQDKLIDDLMVEDCDTAFNLSADLMLRATYIDLTNDEFKPTGVLLFNIHHIASDGWSVGILIKEFVQHYQAILAKESSNLPPLPIQYADYAQWQRNWLKGDVLDNQIEYWANKLVDLPMVHSLPLDFIRPKTQTSSGRRVESRIGSEISKKFLDICQLHGSTLFMGLHAVFSVLLARYSHENDIVVGTPIANREQAEVANLIGFFVNTLVLRSDLSGNPSFVELLNQSKDTLLEAFTHQQVPFEQIVERLKPVRSTSYSPLIQIMLVLQNNEEENFSLSDLALTPHGRKDGMSNAKYDLALTLGEENDGLVLVWEYNVDLFKPDTIEQMSLHFELLLSAVIAAPNDRVFSLDFLSEKEREKLLVEWNQTQTDFQSDKCIHELFEWQALQNPSGVALLFQGQELSYKDLNERANRLAHYLIQRREVQPDRLIGICLERSFDLIIAILGVLKAGCAFVPLDPDYPEARLNYILLDANLDTVLTSTSVFNRTPINESQALCLDDGEFSDALATQSTENICVEKLGLQPQHLAYVIYTSGSTGNPKGCLLSHSGICNFMGELKNRFEVSSESQVLQFASIAFDAAVCEIFMSLSLGASLILITNDNTKSPLEISTAIEDHKVTHAFFPPVLLPLLDIDRCKSIKLLVVAGDMCSMDIAEKWSSGRRFINGYGPTETTVCATIGEFSPEDDKIHIGRPIQNFKAYVFSENQTLTPIGVAGELYIGGAGLARGYLNRPELTAEKFVENPFCNENDPGNPRLYRTGDLVRWQQNGNLEFIGRVDHQVKLRGFRIELGEIEAALRKHDKVSDALVLSKKSDLLDEHLVGYIIVPQAECNSLCLSSDEMDIESHVVTARRLLLDEFREDLGECLPDYMVPSEFVLLECFPLTPNGKVDRKQMLAMDTTRLASEYVAPSSKTEKALCEVCAQVLGLEQVGLGDNFFQIGGHSLLIIQVITRLQERGISLSIRQLFNAPVLGDLASEIDSAVDTEIFHVPENLIPDSCQRITPDMLPLVRLSKREIVLIASKVPGGVENIQDIYPLAPLQEGILFTNIINEYNDPLVLPTLFRIENKDAIDTILQRLQILIDRHDVYRTAVLWDGLSIPVQVVYRKANLSISWLEWGEDADVYKEMLSLSEPSNQTMDLTQAPLLKISIALDKKTGHHFALLICHHIIMDHASLEILQKEFSFENTSEYQTQPRVTPYRNFVAQALPRAKSKEAEEYFKTTLGDVNEPTAPFDLLDIRGGTNNVIELIEDLPPTVSRQIREECRGLSISPAVFFHAAWAIVMSVCSGRDDVVFGTVVSGRLQGVAGAEDMMGVFINTLPLRVKTLDLSAQELIFQVKDSLQALLPFEQTSLTLPQHCSSLAGGTALYSAVLNYRHSVKSEVENEPTLASELEIVSGQERSNYPFVLSVDDFGDDFALNLQISDYISSERVMAYVQKSVSNLLEGLRSTAENDVGLLSVLPEPEVDELCIELSSTSTVYSERCCVQELFEKHAQMNPDAIAVEFEDEHLTYSELNKKANRLAHYLISHRGVTPGCLIGICMERSLEMVISILGILKSGGAYVPIDMDYPDARISYILEDANLDTILANKAVVRNTPITEKQVLCIDDSELISRLALQPDTNVRSSNPNLQEEQLAYVIYTSGSTGDPKGVLLTHVGLYNLISEEKNSLEIVPESRVLQFASIAFDAATWEIFMALSRGASLILLPSEAARSMDEVSLVVQASQVTHALLPPAVLPLLKMEFWKSVSTLIVGGDRCPESQAKKWSRGRKFFNAYGPSEATICVTMGQYTPNQSRLSIGRPIQNIKAYILLEGGSLAPLGVTGELHVEGLALAQGYLNRPELTAKKFIPNPFYDHDDPSSRKTLLRTGDLVRYGEDGNIMYVGRIDNQVKVRGYRIELGEIESQLKGCNLVDTAVVLLREDETLQSQLTAYIEVKTDALMSEDEIVREVKSQARSKLPSYMVPTAFVIVDDWPLNFNGKVDTSVLRKLDKLFIPSVNGKAETETELHLVSIWAEVLKIDHQKIGVNDSFFELGGDSLSAVALVSKMHERFDERVAVKDIFALLDIKNIAAMIDNSGAESVGFGVLSNRVNDDLENLFVAPALGLSSAYYYEMSVAGSEAFNSVFLTTPGIDDHSPVGLSVFEHNFDARVDQWLSAIRHHQPNGNYVILGHSYGGAIAFEIARELESQDAAVELILVDTLFPVIPDTRSIDGLMEEISIEKSTTATEENYAASVMEGLMMPKGTDSKIEESYRCGVEHQLSILNEMTPRGKIRGRVSYVAAKQADISSEVRSRVLNELGDLCDSEIEYYEVDDDHKEIVRNKRLHDILINLYLS